MSEENNEKQEAVPQQVRLATAMVLGLEQAIQELDQSKAESAMIPIGHFESGEHKTHVMVIVRRTPNTPIEESRIILPPGTGEIRS